MRKKLSIIISLILFSLLFSKSGICLNSADITRLKKAEISDQTIELMMQQKVIETCAFTIDEILDLKKAGLSEKTIQMVIKEGSFMQEAEPIVYGRDIRPSNFMTANDIIQLKNAGLSDKTIQAIIIFGARDANDVEREKAWEMLRNMGIFIDLRKADE